MEGFLQYIYYIIITSLLFVSFFKFFRSMWAKLNDGIRINYIISSVVGFFLPLFTIITINGTNFELIFMGALSFLSQYFLLLCYNKHIKISTSSLPTRSYWGKVFVVLNILYGILLSLPLINL